MSQRDLFEIHAPLEAHQGGKPEPARFTGQRGEILAMLQRGPATNVELSKIGLRFGARLKELRDAGYQIVIVSEVGGVVTYALKGGPT